MQQLACAMMMRAYVTANTTWKACHIVWRLLTSDRPEASRQPCRGSEETRFQVHATQNCYDTRLPMQQQAGVALAAWPGQASLQSSMSMRSQIHRSIQCRCTRREKRSNAPCRSRARGACASEAMSVNGACTGSTCTSGSWMQAQHEAET